MNKKITPESIKNLSGQLDIEFALQATGFGVWELDTKSNSVSWDDRCRQLFGLKEDRHLSYEDATSYIHQQDVESVNKAVQKAISPGSDGSYDQTFRTIGADDGKLRWVRFFGRAYFADHGELYRFAGIAHDVTEQKLTEQRESDAVQQILLQKRILETISTSTPDLMYIFDLNYRFTFANQALLDMWGTDLNSSIGKRLLDMGYEPWHARMHEREIDQVIESRNSIRGEVSFPHATLGRRVYDYVFAPVINETGQVEAVAGTTRDITEIRAAQQLSKQTELRFRKLVETNINPIFVLKGEEMLLEIANQPVLDAWMIDQKAFGRPIAEILPEINNLSATLMQVYHSGKPRYLKETPVLYNRTGEEQLNYYNLLIQPFTDGNERICGVTVMATDITEQIVARHALERKETALTNAIELADLGTWSIDTTNRSCILSAKIAEWFGFDELTVGLEAYLDCINEQDRSKVRCSLLGLIGSVDNSHYDQVYGIANIKNGQKRIIHAVGRVYSDTSQSGLRIDGSAQDITAMQELTVVLENQVQQRTEELAAINWKLESSNKELEQANTLLTVSNDNLQNFTYIASHDLQEPLRKIQQFGQLLQNQSNQSSSALDYIKRMQSAARRMSALIQDISDFSRVTNQQVFKETVSLDDIISNVLHTLELQIQENQAEIIVDDLPQISGDTSQLAQLFQNLISNAVKFHRPSLSPSIHISCETIQASELQLSVKPALLAEYYYQINVTDNGIGFDEKYLDRIFQVFQRLHGKTEFPGTGIGLAICQRVVNNHGGAITANSQVGHGSSFKIYFPVEFVFSDNG